MKVPLSSDLVTAQLKPARVSPSPSPAFCGIIGLRRATPRKLSYKEERELEALEQTIAETEARIREIEGMFSDPDFFVRHGRQSAELQKEMEERKRALETSYSRWEELESKKESFQ